MIAVIAGTGTLPIEACKALIQDKKDFFVLSLFPEDNGPALQTVLDQAIITGKKPHIISQPFYKASECLATLKQHKTTHVLMIGKVDKNNLLKKVKFDWLAVKLLASLVTKNDTEIMERIVAFLAEHNMQIIKQDAVLKALLVQPGVLAGTLTPELEANIIFGIKTACMLSEHDIGQTVIIKDHMVLAVEAIEGTDNCIKRGIDLGITDVIVCKAAKSSQNRAFDLPTLGPNSLKNIQPGQVSAIAWLWSHTLIAQKDLFIEQANKLGITLVSYKI
ncbi:MAG: UDP-2,3-diacylglucosamine diphosphatase LpxI [bacterium]